MFTVCLEMVRMVSFVVSLSTINTKLRENTRVLSGVMKAFSDGGGGNVVICICQSA